MSPRRSERSGRPTERGHARTLSIAGRPWQVVLIALEKAVSTILLAAAAVVAFFVRTRPGANPVEVLFSRRMVRDPHNQLVHWLALKVPALSPDLALIIGIGLVFWSLLFAAETVGVWLRAAWGELLVIAETALFLPVNVWRLVHDHRGLEWVTTPINLLILGYLSARVSRAPLRRDQAAASRARGRRSRDGLRAGCCRAVNPGVPEASRRRAPRAQIERPPRGKRTSGPATARAPGIPPQQCVADGASGTSTSSPAPWRRACEPPTARSRLPAFDS